MVLVGAGHTHAVVLERWAKGPTPDARLTLVTDRRELLYSGMIPGFLAGEYERHELVVDAGELARRAGARLVVGSVTEVDAERHRIALEEGGSVEDGGTVDHVDYDVASLDVGSTIEGLATPGVREHAVGARSADELSGRFDDLLARSPEATVVVVGGGAAGVELAAVARARLRARVTLVEEAEHLLPGRAASVSGRVRRALDERGVEVRLNSRVSGVEADAVALASGERLASDLTVWATGAAAHPFLRRSGLPVDAEGFVEVRADLRVRDVHDLFAAGDCASLPGRGVPKAGVHAVRQGPVLFESLTAEVESRSGRRCRPPPARYRPQRDFLSLLNLGDGTALGTKWGITLEGRWIRWVKDLVDRRFVERLADS